MKKILSLILSSILLCSALSITAMAKSDISVYVDNELTELTDANGNTVYPFIQNGTTYIPVRGISQALDCVVEWDGDNQNVMIYKDIEPANKVFRNNSDDVKLYVDNEEKKLYDANGAEVKPFIKDGTTYVPLRGVSQALDCWVRWNGQNKSVSIYINEVPPDGVTMSELMPYEVDWQTETYYENGGSKLSIGNDYFTNALNFKFYDGYAIFNLNSKFDTVSMTVGEYYGWNNRDTTISYIVDEKIVDTYTVTPNSSVEEISVNLNKGNQLKIVIDNPQVRIGQIVFWGE